MTHTYDPILVSIVIPCFNHGQFLSRAVECALQQTYPRIEVVIVDDGSTDDTSRIAAGYAGRTKYTYKKNAGLSAARNTGIAESSGRALLFLDADDQLSLDAVTGHVESLTKNPDALISYSGYEYREQGKPVIATHEPIPMRSPYRDLLIENRFPSHAYMVQRDAFARVGLFDVSLNAHEDWDMWLRFAAAGLVFVQSMGGHAIYNKAPVSMSSNALVMYDTAMAVIQKHRDAISRDRAVSQALKRRIRAGRFSVAHVAYQSLKRVAREQSLRSGTGEMVRWLRRYPWLAWKLPQFSAHAFVARVIEKRSSIAMQNYNELPTLADPFTVSRYARRCVGRIVRAFRRFAIPETRAPFVAAPYIGFSRSVPISRGDGKVRRALISYVVEPFHRNEDDVQQVDYAIGIKVIEMAKALNRLGFVVDIVDYLDGEFTPACSYEIFIGTHKSFERIARKLPSTTLKLYYATRAHASFHRKAQESRLMRLSARRGPLPPLRELEDMLEGTQIAFADAGIILGSAFTRSTYEPHHAKLFTIDTVALRLKNIDIALKDFAQARTEFLYLASWPFVKKGLDLVLEAFAALPNLKLWICAPVQAEPNLMRLYRRELFQTPHIRTVGWTSMHSPLFARIANRCAFMIFPSAAEGSAGAVVNSMAAGLIPIVTREAGVDVDGVGVELSDSEIETIRETAIDVASWTESRTQLAAERSRRTAIERYSGEKYGQRIEQIIRTMFCAR